MYFSRKFMNLMFIRYQTQNSSNNDEKKVASLSEASSHFAVERYICEGAIAF